MKSILLCSCLITLISATFNYPQNSFIKEIYNSEKVEYTISVESKTYTLYKFSVNDPGSLINGLQVCVIKIPSGEVSLKINAIQKKDSINSIFKKSAVTRNSILVSGGFWGYNKNLKEMPIGLVVSNKRIMNKKANWKSGGVLFSIRDSIGVAPISLIEGIDFDEALQSKPLVVKDSRNDIYSNDFNCFDRVCVGISNRGEIVICGIFNATGRGLSLFEFAGLLTFSGRADAPDMKIALAMDGGPSSHIYIPQLGIHFGAEVVSYVPNLITLIFK